MEALYSWSDFGFTPHPQKKKTIHVAIIFSNSDCVKYYLISFCNLQVLHLSGIVISFSQFQFFTTSPMIFCPWYECRKKCDFFCPILQKKKNLWANYQNVFFECSKQRDIYFCIVGVKFKLNNSSFAVTKWNNYFTGVCGPWTMPNEGCSGCLW